MQSGPAVRIFIGSVLISGCPKGVAYGTKVVLEVRDGSLLSLLLLQSTHSRVGTEYRLVLLLTMFC